MANKHDFSRKIWTIFSRPAVIALLGAIIGIVFFGLFYGYNLADPTNVSWIFTDFAHDTGQHQLGWEFFRAGSSGGRITTLATPSGIPITFMDSIPLFALIFRFFGNLLPANFQYFGIFALLNYAIFGALSAMILLWIFKKIFAKFTFKDEILREQFLCIFILAGCIFFVVSPMLIARTFYHTALSAQWLILLGFVLILYRKKLFSQSVFSKTKSREKVHNLLSKIIIYSNDFFAKIHSSKNAKFVLIWSAIFVITMLIHPYFAPMMAVLMFINSVLISTARERKLFANVAVRFAVPLAIALLAFVLIGGFSLGGNSGAVDLKDKGFDLASFFAPGGYSSVFPGAVGSIAKSGSSETFMWLGAGAIFAILFAGAAWILKIFREKINIFSRIKTKILSFGKLRFWLIFASVVGLLILALSPSIQFAGTEIFKYPVPDFILKIWQNFRASAREAWPFYYALQFFAIFSFMNALSKIVLFSQNNIFSKMKNCTENAVIILTLAFLAVVSLQFSDVFFSPNAQSRMQNFAKFADKTAAYQFSLNLQGVKKITQTNLVNLDLSASGDLREFNILGQTAIENKMSLNIGYFARTPEAAKAQQKSWNDKFKELKADRNDFRENLFITKDEKFAKNLENKYAVYEQNGFYIIDGMRGDL